MRSRFNPSGILANLETLATLRVCSERRASGVNRGVRHEILHESWRLPLLKSVTSRPPPGRDCRSHGGRDR